MSLTTTGVTVLIRSTRNEYGMHDKCANGFIDLLIDETGLSTLSGDFPAVIIGPLFAEPGEWTCAMVDCPNG